MPDIDKRALEYHAEGRPGKIEVVSTKAVSTQRDLSLAYSPGVAAPCREIAKDEDLSFRYTARGNLVAVISNGTAVLGLGDIGPHAAKPVMEGKGVLFKRFADIDVFDIEVAETDVDRFVAIVKALEPTFGGVNLEDIAAPACFEIEKQLREQMSIPVFHDDQHGTAIITGAALLNALEICEKDIASVRVVVSGAGASAIACTNFYISLGVRRENVLMVDSKGVIYQGRTEGMNAYKEAFAVPTEARTLADAMDGADVFLGLSRAGLVTPAMVAQMAARPLIFALANPDPEIAPPDAHAVRDDIIMGTGRSDYPNQVNNVLCFPFMFRGAMDVQATAINEPMKIAAARALAALAREEVPDAVSRAYGNRSFRFGPDYIIPTPFDPRVLLWVAPAVAQAAVDSGASRRHDLDVDEYRRSLQDRVSRPHEVMRTVFAKAKPRQTRIAFPEGDSSRIQRAALELLDAGICKPVLVGPAAKIATTAKKAGLDIDELEILDHTVHPDHDRFVQAYLRANQRRGLVMVDALRRMQRRNYFSAMLLEHGHVDGVVTGLTTHYGDAIRPFLQIVKTRSGVRRASGAYICVFKREIKILADTTVIPNPSAEELVDIASHTAALARYFDLEPRVAMLSYSNFGTGDGPSPTKMSQATALLRRREPELMVDGEMQADVALMPETRDRHFDFCELTGSANVLVFPNLDAANAAYKLLWRLGDAEIIGPILMGMGKAVNILQMNASVDDIVNLAAVTAVRAQEEEFAS